MLLFDHDFVCLQNSGSCQLHRTSRAWIQPTLEFSTAEFGKKQEQKEKLQCKPEACLCQQAVSLELHGHHLACGQFLGSFVKFHTGRGFL